MKTTIYIKDYFPAFISTRKSIQLFKDNVSLKKGGSYIIDFIDIIFISRSFADELIKYLNDIPVKFRFANQNSNINAILVVVQKTQTPVERHFDHIAITYFANRQELSSYLATF
jgi:hypothetical protein